MAQLTLISLDLPFLSWLSPLLWLSYLVPLISSLIRDHRTQRFLYDADRQGLAIIGSLICLISEIVLLRYEGYTQLAWNFVSLPFLLIGLVAGFVVGIVVT
jgi:hypothetical protein